jgi:cytochrome c biogenesis protein
LEEKKEVKSEPKKPSGGPLKAVWDFFTNLKLTVVLLIILALVSIIGTIVDQTDPNKNMQMFISLFGPESAPGVLRFVVRIGLTNMYHSWWFVGLLMMLSANITVCTLERLPRVLHMVARKQEPLTDETLKSLALKKELTIKGDAAAFRANAGAAIKAMGYSPRQSGEGGEFHCYAEKGKYSRLGVYITHTSVLIIFAGALIGSFWGYKGYVQISEGQSIDSVGLINKPLLKHYGSEVPLGFSVRCDKFQLKMYESGMPSDYLSTLTIIDHGKDVEKKTIRVNDPMEYKGIRFFQSSYGVSPGLATMTIRATAKASSTLSVKDYNLKKDETVKLEGSDLSMTLADMAPDVAIGPDNQLVAQSDQYRGRGAAVLRFTNPAGELVDQAVILNQVPDSQPRKLGYTFQIMGYKGPYYTGLQVTYDPGVWVVWIGCIAMVLGILIAFFTFHKRVWVRMRAGEKGQVLVTVAGSSNKNKHAFELEFQRLLDKLGLK